MKLPKIYKNSETGFNHVEDDCSFTMIGKPFFDKDLKNHQDVKFEFEWNESKTGNIKVNLIDGTVLYYGAFGIMHRQRSPSQRLGMLYDHWNLSAYANKNFFNHVRSSLKRQVQHK